MDRDTTARAVDRGETKPAFRLGISSCLLGNEVRYDGRHKRDRFLTDVLGPLVEWVPVCPEVEVGMGIPRPAVRLVRRGTEIRMLEKGSGRDHTETMSRWVRSRVKVLARLGLRGYILKNGSPSCGMERVPLFAPSGAVRTRGRGLFTDELMRQLPALPVEEEGRLNDPYLKDNFLERVFAYDRLRSLFDGRWNIRNVVNFHTAHKYQIQAHSPAGYRQMERLVASVKDLTRAEFRRRYEAAFMEALGHRATTRRHVNVQQYLFGHLRERIDATSRAELLAAIEDYGKGLLPLIVPITLLRHHVTVHEVEPLRGQWYLHPHPKELILRNHV